MQSQQYVSIACTYVHHLGQLCTSLSSIFCNSHLHFIHPSVLFKLKAYITNSTFYCSLFCYFSYCAIRVIQFLMLKEKPSSWL